MLYEDLTKKIINACMEVHKELGCGFLEPVYQDALSYEFSLQNIPFEREKKIEVFYKKHNLGREYFADLICYNKIIVELKSVTRLVNAHKAQALNYLNATKLKVGLLVNFGEASLKWERIYRFDENELSKSANIVDVSKSGGI
jgi:GxxExxY protein